MIVFVIAVVAAATLSVAGTQYQQRSSARRTELSAGREAAARAAEFERTREAERERRQREASEQDRRQREQEARDRVLRQPLDLVERRAHEMNADLAEPKSEVQSVERDRLAAEEVVQELPLPAHGSFGIALRIACMVLLPVLVIVGAVLNVEVFVALNGGLVAGAPILKGSGASVVEVLGAVYVANWIHHRQPRSLGWQVQLAAGVAGLVLMVGIVTVYAPQRSAQAFERRIDIDERTLTATRQLQPPDPLALTAAQNRLEADRARLHRAEDSDKAFAAGFPIAEVLTGELALEGALAIGMVRRRRGAQAVVKSLRAREDGLNGRIEQIRAARTATVAGELHDAGVVGFGQFLAPPPRMNDPAQLAAGPSTPQTPPRDPIAPRPRPDHGIDLGAFAPPTNPTDPPNHEGPTNPRWDLF